MSQRFAVYWHDLIHFGPGRFFTDRFKKRPFTRFLFSLFRPDFIPFRKYRLYLDKFDTVVCESLYQNHIWEPQITRLFPKLLSCGGVVVDVGAHIGYFTVLAASYVGRTGQVFAFEPSPATGRFLKRNISANSLSQVTFVPQAVSHRPGLLNLYLSSDNHGDHRVYATANTRPHVQVISTSLDAYFSNSQVKISLLKIDIQGFEYQALLGARHLLSQNRISAIITEFCPQNFLDAGTTWQAYIRLLQQSGFRLYLIPDDSSRLQDFSPQLIRSAFAADPEFTTNLLALRHHSRTKLF